VHHKSHQRTAHRKDDTHEEAEQTAWNGYKPVPQILRGSNNPPQMLGLSIQSTEPTSFLLLSMASPGNARDKTKNSSKKKKKAHRILPLARNISLSPSGLLEGM